MLDFDFASLLYRDSSGDDPDDDDDSKRSVLLWTKCSFIVAAFLEALIAGWYPTYSQSCRESPKIMGIANSFAGGVFIAIAFMHIIPEQIETWNDLPEHAGKDVFPMPELLVFFGYTLILIIDKVLFDSKALFENANDQAQNDPAEEKFQKSIRSSMSKKGGD